MHIAHARSSFRSNIEKKDNIEARLCTVSNRSSTGLRNGTTRERSIGDSFPYLRTKHHYHIPSTMDTAVITPVEEQNAYLELAKTHLSEDMMSIKDFVRVTGYNIDPLIIDCEKCMHSVSKTNGITKLYIKTENENTFAWCFRSKISNLCS